MILSWQLYILIGLFGLVTGSYLNYMALRSIYESTLPASLHCPKCRHRPAVRDYIAIISFLISNGRCRFCSTALPWQYACVEIITALLFVTIVHFFGLSLYALGMLFFASVLIAICITDFREKLIPHEITYPAIICGIIFSTVIRHDISGTLAGIGVSYIFFDFLAFYGLKLYLWFRRPAEDSVHYIPWLSMEGLQQKLGSRYKYVRSFRRAVSFESSTPKSLSKPKSPIEHEDLEVMGGGDAVLSALISAWLGLPRLVLALLIGFAAGTVMGAIYLIHELYKQRLLGRTVRPALIGMVGSLAFLVLILNAIACVANEPVMIMPWLPVLALAAFGGALIGIIAVGGRFSKPFPFGPALAIGAALCIFKEQDPFQ